VLLSVVVWVVEVVLLSVVVWVVEVVLLFVVHIVLSVVVDVDIVLFVVHIVLSVVDVDGMGLVDRVFFYRDCCNNNRYLHRHN
jgi:hypothetical protein